MSASPRSRPRWLETRTWPLSVDASRLAVAGFSDGASFGLSLGLINGDLVTHVLALSPGFAAPTMRRGRPLVFQSHGVDDEVLPIDETSRRLVPMLERAGYWVRYCEFSGGHAVPPEIAREAVAWVARQPRGRARRAAPGGPAVRGGARSGG